jgi:AcrR family transcriptional regulator
MATARMTAEARRAQLLDVLADLVIAEGFGAVSIDRVAREAGIARTVVYSHFGDLPGLLDALADRAEQRALTQVRELVPEPPIEGDPDDVLVDAISAVLAIVREDPRTWRIVLHPPEGAPAAQRHRYAAGRDAVIALLVPVVTWGLEQRGGPEGLDPELFARALVTLCEDAARLTLRDPERYSPERMTGFVRVLLRAMRP